MIRSAFCLAPCIYYVYINRMKGQKTFMWGDDLNKAWERLKAEEVDNPNDSEMLRRLIGRMSGLEFEERRRGRPTRWHTDPTEIADCGLSTRAANALIAAGITTIAQLKQVEHLSRIPGLGPASVKEVMEFLSTEAEE